MKTLLRIATTLLLLGITTQGALAHADNKHKVALVMKALSNPFFSKMERGAKQHAQQERISLEVFGTELETDVDHQVGIIRNLIARGYGAIVIAPADSKKLVPVLKEAIEQGIVVVNIDNPLDKDVQARYAVSVPFVGSDNRKGAALVGAYVRNKLHGRGRVIIIEGIRGVMNAELRKTGFIEALTEHGGIQVLASETANWHTEDAFTVMSNLLERYGPVDAVFCANDQMALGAVQALDLRGLTGQVLVAGYDNIEAVRNEMRNGRIHATIEQHPELMGEYGVELAAQMMSGKKVGNYRETPLDLVTYEGFDKRIGLSISELGNPFFRALYEGAREKARLFGFDLLSSNAENDDARQLITIEEFIERHVDVIVVNPTSSQMISPGIEMARSARIPVITVDRKEEAGLAVCHIASDNVAGGRLAAGFLVRALKGKGDIVEFEGIPGTSVTYERGKGFNDVIGSHKDLRVITREVANFDRVAARRIMDRLLEKGLAFDAVFAHNDAMILGVMDSLQAAGRRGAPVLVGFDAIPEALEALEAGRISATVAQKPEQMGDLAMVMAMRILRNETVPRSIPVELQLIERPTTEHP